MQFSVSTDIAAPAERVWQVMSDIDRWHEWTPSITSVKRLRDKPFAVGTRAMIRQPKFPPAFWKITSIEPGRSFTWVSVAPGLRVTGRHEVMPTTDGSRAKLSLDLEGLFGDIFGRITKDLTERYLAMEARGLQARSLDPGYNHAAAVG